MGPDRLRERSRARFARAAGLVAALLAMPLAGGNARADDDPPPEAPAPEEGATPEAPPRDSDGPPNLLERIEKAITQGVAWLKAQPQGGTWGHTRRPGARTYDGESDVYENPGGPTALSL